MKKHLLFFTLFFTSTISFSQLSSNALHFDGVDDVVGVPNAYYGGLSDFTIEAWIRDEAPTTLYTEENIISNREDDSGVNGFRVSITDGALAYFGRTGGISCGFNLHDNNCHHIAVVRQSYVIRFYIDGVVFNLGFGDSTNTSSSKPNLLIGAKYDAFPNCFNGLIKEVRIWNIARSTSQIQNNMNVVLNGAANPNLIGYWRCNAGSGNILTDYSLNSNHGFFAGPAWSTGCPGETLNLKVFIQGYYVGNSSLRASLNPVTLPFVFDSVTVELHQPVSPFSIAAAKKGIIGTNGVGNFSFPTITLGSSYYIVVKHRNAVQTWSKNPVLFNSSIVNFDFTNP